ncbi:MAG: hypothetical protein PHO65_07445 [Sulfurovum sp.]|nr:hypothetical protein [Sulfurovum sp.]
MKGKIFTLISILLLFVATYVFYKIWHTKELDSKLSKQVKENSSINENTSLIETPKLTSSIKKTQPEKNRPPQLSHSVTSTSKIPPINLKEEQANEPEPLHPKAGDIEQYTEKTYEDLTPLSHYDTMQRADQAFEDLDQKVQDIRGTYLH